jgi:hypothetical protein
MNLVQRAKDMLLKPQETWPVVADEPSSVAELFSGYLIILAAIPAIAGFIGLSIIGMGAFGVSIRVPIVSGLAHMVVTYALSLAMMYGLALIVDALAPNFGGTKNSLNAMKLIAFSSTAAMVGGIFSLIPALGILGLLASLYSLYTLYLGLPILMKCPADKSVIYTVVIVVCAIVLGLIIGAVGSVFMPGPTVNLR